MRIHPIALALRFLNGQHTISGAPFYGRPFFENEQAAVDLLTMATGACFGNDVVRWIKFLRQYPWLYDISLDDPRFGAVPCPDCNRGQVYEQAFVGHRLVSRRVACPECIGRGIISADTPALVADFLERDIV